MGIQNRALIDYGAHYIRRTAWLAAAPNMHGHCPLESGGFVKCKIAKEKARASQRGLFDRVLS
jgi:hypothetical protein